MDAGVLGWGWDPSAVVWRPIKVSSTGALYMIETVDHLNDIGDVNVPTPADNTFLYWDAAASKWQSRVLADGDIPAAIARDAEVAAAVADHAALTTGVHAFDKSARVYHDVNQSIPNNSWTILAFNSERWDTDGIHDPVTNNSRLTCKTAGKYSISIQAAFDTNATGFRALRIVLNGALFIARIDRPAVNYGWTLLTLTTLYQLSPGDFVETVLYQNSGGPLNANTAGNIVPEFMMARIA